MGNVVRGNILIFLTVFLGATLLYNSQGTRKQTDTGTTRSKAVYEINVFENSVTRKSLASCFSFPAISIEIYGS